MLVARKYLDAGAALSCGGGVVLVTVGIKPVPSVISYLGFAAAFWSWLLILGCVGAAIGCLMRTRDLTKVHRRETSIKLERIFWPVIAVCASLFCLGVVYRFGWIDAAQTLGWAGFVILTCTGHWWAIRRAARDASVRAS